ncbi:MAG: hypothetical protein RBR08_01405 [Desulforegulaceae bacterium]|nr:hypothetical protein [Desulforegulaceae bacterium]
MGKRNQLNFLKILLLALFLALTFACSSSDSDDKDTNDDVQIPAGERNITVADISASNPVEINLSSSTIADSGGTITSPDIPNFKIEIPEGAVNESIEFSVEMADITGQTGLPENLDLGSKMYIIETSGSAVWNEYKLFNKPVKVTLPVSDATSIDSWLFYSYNSDGTLEGLGFDSIDKTNKTITFEVRTFGSTLSGGKVPASYKTVQNSGNTIKSVYVAIGTLKIWQAFLTGDLNVDSGFRPSGEGWYIPNYGAYYKSSRGGNCMGMCTWANYWFRKHGTGFRSKYHDPQQTSTWVDDSTAIELASRAHAAESAIWNQYVSKELSSQRASSADVAKAYIGTIYVTGVPALVGMYQAINTTDGLKLSAGHAISVYKASIEQSGECKLYVYDPNFPNKDTRYIKYVDGTGFYIYNGGPSASDPGYSYNYFKQFGYSFAVSDSVFDALKISADKGFSDDSVFPEITITSIKAKNIDEDVLATEEKTENGETLYKTKDNAIVIKGTVLGGNAQVEGSVVNNINIVVTDEAYSTSVNNTAGSGDGSFEIVLPLKKGDNEVVFLASKENSFSHWAAFKRVIVNSDASPASMTITLSWGQNNSDVDLYVKEPDFEGATGDTVYYSHREGASATHPYLDFDNTYGYGPEHYIGKWGMSTLSSGGASNPNGLYGDYTVAVHYYDDDDEDYENFQPISWNVHWRYLAWAPYNSENPEEDGIWIEGSRSGVLTAANSGTDGSINSGPEWSEAWTISYDNPQDFDFSIPEAHTVMLP